jgi:hypothetical protein
MRAITRFFAETLNNSAEFTALSNSLLGGKFNFYINVDLATLTEVLLPYFSMVTFEDKDDKEVEKKFKAMFLIGIERQDPVTVSGITEEPTLDNLEQLTRKAVEIIEKDLRTFGIDGDTNIRFTYINMYVPSPDGEDDLQMQVDIELESEKFLQC